MKKKIKRNARIRTAHIKHSNATSTNSEKGACPCRGWCQRLRCWTCNLDSRNSNWTPNRELSRPTRCKLNYRGRYKICTLYVGANFFFLFITFCIGKWTSPSNFRLICGSLTLQLETNHGVLGIDKERQADDAKNDTERNNMEPGCDVHILI